MSKSKLFYVLSTFKDEEWKTLRKFILSNHERSSDNAQLFLLLYKHRSKLKEPNGVEFFKDQHFAHMSRRVFQNMLSRVFQLTEAWLVQYQLQKEKYQSNLLLVKFYNRQGLFKLADEKAKILRSQIDGSKGWDLETSKAEAQLIHQQYYSDNPIKYKEGVGILESLVKAHLEQYKLQTIMYQSEMHNWGQLQKYDYDELQRLTSQSLFHLADSELSDQLYILKNLIENPNEDSLYILATQLFAGRISNDADLHVIYTIYLMRFAIQLWKEGKLTEPKILAQILSYGLESGTLLKEGKIPLVRFQYLCSLISSITDFQKTEEFINQWITIVNTSDYHSTKMIALAQNCLYHDREEDIILHTRTVKFLNISTRLKVAALNLMSYYKTRDQDFDMLIRQIQNIKILVRRGKQKSMIEYNQGIKNFVKVIELLIKKDKKGIDIDLNSYAILPFRFWLNKQILEKIN